MIAICQDMVMHWNNHLVQSWPTQQFGNISRLICHIQKAMMQPDLPAWKLLARYCRKPFEKYRYMDRCVDKLLTQFFNINHNLNMTRHVKLFICFKLGVYAYLLYSNLSLQCHIHSVAKEKTMAIAEVTAKIIQQLFLLDCTSSLSHAITNVLQKLMCTSINISIPQWYIKTCLIPHS